MLKLTRRIGESLMIADNIQIKLLKGDDSSVRFGIIAPREVTVHREEVYNSDKRKDYEVIHEPK